MFLVKCLSLHLYIMMDDELKGRNAMPEALILAVKQMDQCLCLVFIVQGGLPPALTPASTFAWLLWTNPIDLDGPVQTSNVLKSVETVLSKALKSATMDQTIILGVNLDAETRLRGFTVSTPKLQYVQIFVGTGSEYFLKYVTMVTLKIMMGAT